MDLVGTHGGVSVYRGDSLRDRPPIGPGRMGTVWDPPWEMGVWPDVGTDLIVFGDGGTLGSITMHVGAPTWCFCWDCVSSWYVPNRPIRRAKYALWYGDLVDYVPEGAFFGSHKTGSRMISNTRGTYRYTPNPQGKRLSDVFSCPITRLHRTGASHSKPLDWIRLLVANCLGHCEVIYDPFGGTGTVALACLSIGVKCVCVEIDRDNADAIFERLTRGNQTPHQPIIPFL